MVSEEMNEKRIFSSKTFDNKDGTFKFQAHTGHIHYEDRGLKEIDTSLTLVNGNWEQAKASYHSKIPEFADGWIVFRDKYHSKDQTVSIKPVCSNVKGILQSDQRTVYYADAFGKDIDLKVGTGNNSLRKEIIIKTKPLVVQDLEFSFETDFPVMDYKLARTKQSINLDTEPEIFGDQLLIGNEQGDGKEWFTYFRTAKAWDSDGGVIDIRIKFFKQGGKLFFKKIIPASFLQTAVYPVFTDTVQSFFAGSGDGLVEGFLTSTTWDAVHDLTDGTGTNEGSTFMEATSFGNGSNQNRGIVRAFIPIDTSGIPDGSTISAATLNIYATAKGDDDNDAQSYISTVINTTQVSTSALEVADFDQCGDAVDDPTEGNDNGDRLDITSITTSAYNTIDLNATGIASISKTGITKIGLREGHDIEDDPHTLGGGFTLDGVTMSTSENTGTSQDPFLEVTFSTTVVVMQTNKYWGASLV